MNDFADAPKTNPIKANFKGKKMLLLMTINGWRKPYTSPTTGASREFVFDIGGPLRHKMGTG